MLDIKLPSSFTARPSTRDDLPATLEIDRALNRKLGTLDQWTLELLESFFSDPDLNLETDTLTVLDGERIIATVSVSHTQHAQLFLNLEIHPDYREPVLADQMLAWVEQRGQQEIVLADPDVRVFLRVSVNSQDTFAQQFYERHGFLRSRRFRNMKIELSEPPASAQWSEGITVRNVTPDILRALYEAQEEAFQDHWGHITTNFEDWKRWSVDRGDFDPSLWFLAMDGEQIAGMALCAVSNETEGWVDTLGVRRPWRKRGVGLALLHHAFGEFYRRGIHEVYLGVDASSLTGATRLYEKAGMHIVEESDRFEKTLRSGKDLGTQTISE